MTIKLLVADDSVTIQKIVSLAFSSEDVLIEAASDGNMAIESVRKFMPDVVLADVFMPGCSGYEVCARIKEDPESAHIPVILLVGTFEPFDEAESARVKSDAYLTKPFDTSELVMTVLNLAAKRASAAPALNVQSEPARTDRVVFPDKGMVSAAALESFLGDNRVLDIFDGNAVAAAGFVPVGVTIREQKPAEFSLSEEAINQIVDKVVRKMSSEVIREVAWEVVPELSESIIRSTLEDRK